MTVRAKFRVVQISKSDTGVGIEMYPVSSGSEENRSFFAATPSGKIEMGIVNAVAAAEFNPGDEFYVDFTKAEKTA